MRAEAAALLVGSLLTPAASADGADADAAAGEPAPVVWHEKLLVTATRSPLEAGAIPLHTTLLDVKTIETTPASGTLDLLRSVPGIDLSRDSGTLVAQPRDQAISMRGLIGSVQSRALPLVDGLPIVDPFGGWTNLALAPKALLDRVEVVRGGGSSAWGNLALSGVVNLITRAPSPRTLGVTARLAERSTADLSAFGSDLGDRWSAWLFADHFETNGYVVLPVEERGPVDEAKSRRWNAVHGRLAWSPTPSTSWTARVLSHDENRNTGLATDRDTQREWSAALSLDRQSRGALWQAQLYHRDLDAGESSGLESLDRTSVMPSAAIPEQPSRSTGASGVGSWSSGRHAITAGADLVDNRVAQREVSGWDGAQYTARYDVSGRQRFAGVFVQDRMTFGERLTLQLGARFDQVWSGDATSVRSSLPDGATTGADPISESTERAFTPSLGVVWAAAPALRARGALYEGFRVGTPFERFVGSSGAGRSITVPNDELSPERLRGGELGVDWTPSRDASLRATVFHNRVDDLIQRILLGRVGESGGFVAPCGPLPGRGRCLQYRNVAEIRSTGLELSGRYRAAERWRLSLDGTWMRSRVAANAADPSIEGNQVERAPDVQVAGSVRWLGRRLGDVTLEGRYVSRAYDDAENTETLPGHLLLGLDYGRELAPGRELFAGVENLLGERYISRWTSGNREINAPRLVYAGVRLRFERAR